MAKNFLKKLNILVKANVHSAIQSASRQFSSSDLNQDKETSTDEIRFAEAELSNDKLLNTQPQTDEEDLIERDLAERRARLAKPD